MTSVFCFICIDLIKKMWIFEENAPNIKSIINSHIMLQILTYKNEIRFSFVYMVYFSCKKDKVCILTFKYYRGWFYFEFKFSFIHIFYTWDITLIGYDWYWENNIRFFLCFNNFMGVMKNYFKSSKP